MTDRRFTAFVTGARNMVAKVKTYGKKTGRDLAASFSQLSLTPKKDEKPETRAPLGTVSSNTTRKQPETSTEKRNTPIEIVPVKEAAVENDANGPITALTSLECVEDKVYSLQDACTIWEEDLQITKIGQGSYATIFRMQMKVKPHVYTVFKLIPIKSKTGKGSRAPDQTLIEDAVSEVKALATMAEIDGFVEFRSARVLQGSMPQLLQDLNTDWENQHSDENTQIIYPKEQLWLLVEMSDAGTDLETLLKKGFPNGDQLHKPEEGAKLTIQQTWDIFWGTAEALARGEALANFEHRDLHPGNICITNRPTKKPSKPDKTTTPKLTNLKVTIIDYTLSRATLDDDSVLANSMKDRGIFAQTSFDETDNRQYNIYRSMKRLIEGGPNVRHGMKWHEYVPMTNILWLYHILKLLVDNTEFFSKDPTGKSFPLLTERKLAQRLAQILGRVNPLNMQEWLYLSAGDVVADEVVYKGNLASAVLEVGVDAFPEDSEIVARYRHARWDRCVAVRAKKGHHEI